MKAISSVLIIMMVLMAGAKGDTCNFLGGLVCTLLPCNLLGLSLWSCSNPLGLTADLTIAPSLLNVKLDLNANLHVNSLSIDGKATVTVDPNVVLDLDANLNVALGSILSIDGTVRVRGKAFINGQVVLGVNGVLLLDAGAELMAGAVINVGSGASVTASVSITVHTGASINVAASANLVLLRGGNIYGTVTINSLGTLTVSATLNVYGTLVAGVNAQVRITATLCIKAGALVNIQGAVVLLADVTISGLLQLTGASSVTLSAGLVVDPTGKVNIGLSASLTIGGLLNLTGEIYVGTNALLKVTLNVTISGNLTIAATAQVNLLARVIVVLGGLISADPGASVELQRGLFIYGTVNLNGCLFSVSGQLTIYADGLLSLTADVQLDLHLGTIIHVGAKLNIGAGALVRIYTDSIIDAPINLALGATLKILGGITRCSVPLILYGDVFIFATLDLGTNTYTQVSGTLTLDASLSISAIICAHIYIKVAATLIGQGCITANAEIDGILSPSVEAQLFITGNCLIKPTATVVIRIGGLSTFSCLKVGGLLTLAGKLLAVLEGLFLPILGNLFHIIDAGSLTGLFNTLDIPSLLHWVPLLSGGNIVY